MWKRFKLQSLSARLIALTLLTLLAVQALSVLIYVKDRDALIDHASVRVLTERVATLIELLDNAPADSQPTRQ